MLPLPLSGKEAGRSGSTGEPTTAGFLPGELVYLAPVSATGRADTDGTLSFPQHAGDGLLIVFGTRSGTLLVLGGR